MVSNGRSDWDLNGPVTSGATRRFHTRRDDLASGGRSPLNAGTGSGPIPGELVTSGIDGHEGRYSAGVEPDVVGG